VSLSVEIGRLQGIYFHWFAVELDSSVPPTPSLDGASRQVGTVAPLLGTFPSTGSERAQESNQVRFFLWRENDAEADFVKADRIQQGLS
jgi:hypothetical protein